MTDCIFCKIVQGEIPSYPIYEDDEVYAFLDITQATQGHTLIIPKQHVADIFELDEVLAANLFAKVPKIARGLEKALPKMQGLNLVNNNKEFAYQSVFHSHIHLIPRFDKNDGFSMAFKDNGKKYSSEEMTATAKKIKETIDYE